ncbi:hypothetical protein [Paraburkholderia phenoliruptrix]|uniref:Uncharacterized protein n=1 Tax=Paraburkholderia phenoliruptrix TaxID=252970 RepID=A0A6J5A6G0_9BURK|nr:hypothetical protein [Paraburkholderia phenoliruptrix]CAB3653190.1 hypothetical protein LMG22037_01084 [Paraburkholderia phenoliruptrix]
MNQEPSDPVERADQRREQLRDGDVKVKSDGTVEQRPHGNMDATLIPKGKDHPSQGPYTPEHDHVDPDLEPGGAKGHPTGKDDLSA